uniref:GntR family transcriptional regulator n=1 Tax=Ndongobacter massiliensis TaxID=1871025 RepID=UPI0009312C0F|nr:GntR family transcriptional regulator [Ndongobacter massiliensis]
MAPKYQVVQRDLKEKIDTGYYRADELIPSERALMESYDVSRITVRRAVSELVRSGYLETIQGKGTYVKHVKSALDILSLTSCTEDIISLGYKPRRKVISAQIVKATMDDVYNLSVEEGEPIFELTRVFYADEATVNYTTSRLRYALFPGLEKYPFAEVSLYRTLEEAYGLELTYAKRFVEAGFPTKKIAKHLEMEQHTPILFFHCTSHGNIKGSDVAFESYVSWFRSDRFAFTINQERKKG